MSYATKYFVALMISIIGGALIVFAFFQVQTGDTNAVWPLGIGFILLATSVPFTVYFKSRKQILEGSDYESKKR